MPERVAVLYTAAGEITPLPEKVRLAEDLTANARMVQKTLQSAGHSVVCVPFGQDLSRLISELRRVRPSVVFNLAEGPMESYEKEPHATALLELLGLPYTGNGPLSLALCKNKARCKDLLEAQGVATPAFCVYDSVPKGRPSLPFPLVVKPLRQDGSLGITDQSVVRTTAELKRAVAELLQSQRQEALVEQFLPGREFNVSLLGNGTPDAAYRVLPPGEFLYHSPRWRVCTFDAKWDEQHPSYAAVEAVCPARLSARLRKELETMTIAAARVFELSGYARLDFRLDAEGRPQLFDVNPNPDLAPRMGIARAAEAAGFSYPEFLEEIVRLGLSKGFR